MPVIRLQNLLNSAAAGDLERIVQRARDLDELCQALRDALPQDLAAALVSVNVRESRELVIVATSSAWAARLRFESAAILAAAAAVGVTCDRCRVNVNRS